ncbi:MAG: hypothetical protein BAJALOKI2v1_700012 [Promethearchaeota archaeon]|nr:MAG: hypothetical protein BAJALOKI2v1_700012 [Candidatus Lokiarchaeota archaeon]
MNDSKPWEKVDYRTFFKKYGVELVVDNAPEILYSKKDKEHEEQNSLILFFILLGGLLIYIAIAIMLFNIIFDITLFIITITFLSLISLFFLYDYLKSNIHIKPIECWFEIFEGKSDNNYLNYCLIYYPIFSGKCHPNEALNILLKLYQEEVLGTTIDITQIEIYLIINREDYSDRKILGYNFLYGKDIPFKDEHLERNSWQFFPYELKLNKNYLATANWEHHYEWRKDLALDYHKLHIYSPWILKRWSSHELKHLEENNKKNLNWSLRSINSQPKLKPWLGKLSEQVYSSHNPYKDHRIIEKAIEKIMESEEYPTKVKEIKVFIPEFKAYFRNLDFQT